MLFRPNTTCLLYSKTGKPNVYNQTAFEGPKTVPCAVISFDLSRVKTSVRADSSGSRARADNLVGIARFLMPRNTTVQRGDKINKHDFWLEVIEIHPRYAVDGRFDHWEVDMKKASAPGDT